MHLIIEAAIDNIITRIIDSPRSLVHDHEILYEGMLFDVYAVLFTLNANSGHVERSVWRNTLLSMEIATVRTCLVTRITI
jgi:hypothetical protein